MSNVTFRYARKNDVPLIMQFIQELAKFEGLDKQLNVNEESLEDWIFIRNKAEVLFELVDDKVIGFCLFYHNFSTFMGGAGLYIEDLYISPEFRTMGYGKKLFEKIAQIAVDRECKKLEFSCPNSNTSSMEFYKHMGASPMSEWTTFRVSNNELKKLAKK